MFQDKNKVIEVNSVDDIEAIEKFFEDSDDEDAEDAEVDVGPTPEEREITAAKFKAGVAAEREKYQPTAMEKILATGKSIILRAMVLYVILW